ncbi:unnamed protein product [Caenorhabditis nigoni]
MSTEEETQADDESFGSITPEFIAHLNSELGTPFLRNQSTPNKPFLRRIGGKRTREDVTSRSRTEIINWVLESAELIKVCICPYCLKIHSRRDNTRVHIKKDHKGWEVREFIEGVDASLDHVRRVNEIGKFNRVVDKRPRISQTPVSTSSTSNLLETNEEQDLKLFDNPLHIFLNDINKLAEQNGDFSEANEESSSSASAVDVSNSTKGSREPTPNCSLLYKSDNMESPQIFNPLTPFGCVFCQASYHRIRDLTIHLNRVHSTRYRCNCCLAQFVQPQHLEHHYSTCHVIETLGKEEVMNNQ